jgi:hypothetical protein
VPKHSGDTPSVSSVSSYANSIVSSDFTLSSSTTDGPPSSLFDHKPHEDIKISVFSAQRYRNISTLEMKIRVLENLRQCSLNWMEAFGDLAHYRHIVIAAMVPNPTLPLWSLTRCCHLQQASYLT